MGAVVASVGVYLTFRQARHQLLSTRRISCATCILHTYIAKIWCPVKAAEIRPRSLRATAFLVQAQITLDGSELPLTSPSQLVSVAQVPAATCSFLGHDI